MNRCNYFLLFLLLLSDDYWIGGTDEVVEGTQVWAAKGTEIRYTNWVPGQGHSPNLVENCLEIVQWNNHVGQFNDDTCTDISYFICEMEYVLYYYMKLILYEKRATHSLGA